MVKKGKQGSCLREDSSFICVFFKENNGVLEKTSTFSLVSDS
jgi:hypothetical protein